MRAFLTTCLLLLSLGTATAQVRQNGTVTPGHVPMWTTTGVIGDGGTAARGFLTSVGVTASGPGICQNSGPTTAAYNQICLNATATSVGITATNVGGATGAFTFTYNGVTQGMALAALPTTAGDQACFSNATGQLVDCSVSTLVNNVTAAPFNAACNGTTVDTVAIQAALTAAITNRKPVLIPGGAVCLSGPLVIATGLTLMGEGPTSTLRADPATVAGTYLLRNTNLGTYADDHITVRDLTIDGNGIGAGGSQTISNGLLGFGRVTDLVIQNVKVYNYQYICVEIASSINARILYNEFTSCGYTGTTLEAGPALWMANSGNTDFSIGALVEGNLFHDLTWTPIYFNVNDSIFNANVIKTVKETAFLVALIRPDSIGKGMTITNNTIDGVTKHTISSSCAEFAPLVAVIANNIVTNCGHSGFYTADGQNLTFASNIVSNVNKEGDGAQGACFVVSSSLASPLQPQNIKLEGNRCFDDQTVVTTYAGITLNFSLGGTTAATGLSILNNDLSGTTFVSGSAFLDPSNVFGAGSIRRGNLPTTVNLALPVAEGGTGLTAGTSGGVPYFSSTTTVASSALLAANQLVLGGGAGTTPATLGSLGTTTTLLHGNAAGAPTFGAVVTDDIVDNAVTLAKLATQATNTVLGNATSGTAAPTALAVGTCSTAASALIWTTNTGFGCNTSITAAAVPVGGITGLGTGVATWLATPSSANLIAAVTDETGTGALVFGTSPTIASPTFSGTVAGANTVPLTILAQSAANTMLGNWTGSTANVTANAMPSCADTTGNHLNYVSGTGVTCGTSGLRSIALTSTRDMTAASGNVSYTGAGFTPTSCHGHASTGTSTSRASINGFADSAKTGKAIFWAGGSLFTTTNFIALIEADGSTGQTATVNSYDADGITLAWTKIGSAAAGTATLNFICYR